MGNCGFVATWDPTHCCIACASGSCEHGPSCERLPLDCHQQALLRQRGRQRSVGMELFKQDGVRRAETEIFAVKLNFKEAAAPDSMSEEVLLDLETFLQMTRQRPELLQKALGDVYGRLNWHAVRKQEARLARQQRRQQRGRCGRAAGSSRDSSGGGGPRTAA
mmetsp:Transcript_45951/g.146673  ORF Transcript_45951/g.146673 Transcript_45951/m.146673 type:complete len:163 (-) Transcript_45951:37-525(-)